MKRFYKEVSAGPVEGGYGIFLDGKPVKTPGGGTLTAPVEKLAAAVAAEWQAQEKDIVPDAMPLMQTLTTMQDRVARERPAIERQVLAYLDTDLLCYRATEPPDLAGAQEDAWNPWLDWFAREYGLTLETTTALAALEQPAPAHEAVAESVASLNDLRFTVLQIVTALGGSLVLALAFVKGDIAPEEFFAATHVEELYKARLYNEDLHGAAPLEEKKQAAFRRDIEAARQVLACLDN